MNRRAFTRTLIGAGLGAIFVPKYERWFRPLEVAKPGLTVAFPAGSQEGDVAILTIQRLEKAIQAVWDDPGAGWAPVMTRGDLAMYSKVLSDFDQPVKLPRDARAAMIGTFRGVEAPSRVNVAPDRRRLLLRAPRITPTYVGHSRVARG
jgi:hypothetical protein